MCEITRLLQKQKHRSGELMQIETRFKREFTYIFYQLQA